MSRGPGAGEAGETPDDEPGGPLEALDDAALRRWRLRSQRLTGPGLPRTEQGLADAVRWSGAVQAQEHDNTLWSLVRRSGCLPLEAASAAFDAAAFVRTHVLRPTWHVVPPESLAPLLALTGPRLIASLGPRWRELGLSPELLADSVDVVDAALADRGPLTRAELREVFEAAGIGTDGQRLPHLLMHAELRGAVCSGPVHGRQHTWARTDRRVPPAAGGPADGREVARDLALAYLRSHGPATERDLAWWAGLPLTAVRAALAAARPAARSALRNGTRFWFAGEPPADADASAPAVHLVPSYDEYLVAYTESRPLADPHGLAARMPRGALLAPALIVDGRVSGTWRKRPVRAPGGGEALEVSVTCLVGLAPAERAELEAEAGRLAAVHGRALRLAVTDEG